MASGRAADREDPGNSRRNAARSLDRDPISELHQGQRSDAPHRRAGHMTAPDQIARTASKALARGGRPHMIFAALACGLRSPHHCPTEFLALPTACDSLVTATYSEWIARHTLAQGMAISLALSSNAKDGILCLRATSSASRGRPHPRWAVHLRGVSEANRERDVSELVFPS